MSATAVGLIIGVILVVITLLLIFWGRQNEVNRLHAPAQGEMQAAAPARTDDLTIIEGIGPKIAGILKLSGITTFAQLAATDVPSLEKILKDNDLQFTKPASWPEQARLAAAGKMDELKTLQDKLVAGR